MVWSASLDPLTGTVRMPVVPHFLAQPSTAELAHVDLVAKQLIEEVPALTNEERYRSVELRSSGEGPALHLDDFSSIHVPNFLTSMDPLQDRARLRAGDEDVVATAQPPAAGY